MSTGQIVGIIFGILLFALVFTLFYYWNKGRKRSAFSGKISDSLLEDNPLLSRMMAMREASMDSSAKGAAKLPALSDLKRPLDQKQ